MVEKIAARIYLFRKITSLQSGEFIMLYGKN